jgi:Mrp family chromosome partitioning ATPase
MSEVETENDSRAALGDVTTVAAQIADPVLASWLVPEGPSFEVFRLLRAKLKSLEEQRPLRCLGVVSATRGEGASTLGLGLATALALDARQRVLVVEASLRAPSLERLLGLAAAPGLGEWLEASSSAPPPIRRIEPWGLFLLAAGAPVAAPAGPLGSARMAQLLSEARLAFDFVIVDCHALDASADTLILQDLVDGFLLVVRARHASRDTLRRAFSHLRADRVRGVILNDRQELLARWLDRRPSHAGA